MSLRDNDLIIIFLLYDSVHATRSMIQVQPPLQPKELSSPGAGGLVTPQGQGQGELMLYLYLELCDEIKALPEGLH